MANRRILPDMGMVLEKSSQELEKRDSDLHGGMVNALAAMHTQLVELSNNRGTASLPEVAGALRLLGHPSAMGDGDLIAIMAVLYNQGVSLDDLAAAYQSIPGVSTPTVGQGQIPLYEGAARVDTYSIGENGRLSRRVPDGYQPELDAGRGYIVLRSPIPMGPGDPDNNPTSALPATPPFDGSASGDGSKKPKRWGRKPKEGE